MPARHPKPRVLHCRYVLLWLFLAATRANATEALEAAPRSLTPPALIVEQSPHDRLLTCKSAFQGMVRRHLEASRALATAPARLDARRAAVDQALALAVLEDAAPGEGEPQTRHTRAAADKRARAELVAYCRTVVVRFVNAQARERPRYLTELRPDAEMMVLELEPDSRPLADEFDRPSVPSAVEKPAGD